MLTLGQERISRKRPNSQEGSNDPKRKCSFSLYEHEDCEPHQTLAELGLNKRIEERHFPVLAPHFDNPEEYAEFGFNLYRSKVGDVRKRAFNNNKLAMIEALKGWHESNPFATIGELIDIIQSIENDENTIDELLAVIKSLKVKCDNRERGCQWEGPVGELDTHIRIECDYTEVPCPNKCKTPDGEVTKLLRKDVVYHNRNQCPKRVYRCKYCQKQGEFMRITTDHIQRCHKVPTQCPNFRCPQKIPRKQVRHHRSTCDYEPVPCRYAEVGCKERPLRKDLKEHEGNSQLHLQITTETVLEMKRAANQKVPQYTFRWINFQKNDEEIFYSPPFYTSSNGYKMRVIVLSIGTDQDASSISLFVDVMTGDNDDSLTWPFKGTVTIELLNQLKDESHHKEIIKFLPNSTRCRPTIDNEIWSECSKLNIISHAGLDYQPDKNCQYLKDDTLVFRVSVQVPDYKPWLECNL